MTKEEVLNGKIKSLFIIENDGSKPMGNPPGATIILSDWVTLVDKELFTEHFKKYNFFDTITPTKMGQFFLYEKLLDGRFKSNRPHDHELFYPKLGLYLNALPSPDSKGSTNKNIRAAYQKQYDYSLAKKSFLEEYLSANGHLRGADSAWDKNNKSYMKQMFGPKGSRAEYSRETEGQPAPAAAKFLGWE